MTRRIYPKPPIVEAVVEMTFPTERKDALLQALGTKLADRYPGERKQQEVFEMSAQVSPDSVAAAARRTPHITLLRSGDGTRLIGCGAKSMSIHQLTPYGGWGTFLEQIDEAVGHFPLKSAAKAWRLSRSATLIASCYRRVSSRSRSS